MRGSAAVASWTAACWWTWTPTPSSPTRASGATASPASARRSLPLHCPDWDRMTATTPADNFRQAELDRFNELAHRWWDPNGPQKALHALNPARLGYVAGRVPLRGAQ